MLKGYALKDAVLHEGKAKVGSVMSKLLADHPELKPRAREIARIAAKIVQEVNSLPIEEQRRLLEEKYPWILEAKREAKKEDRGLPPLPGAVEGKVVTRFAPNPDFVIHLGNARPAILSDEYAKMYKGRMILRFEDTDPRTKKPMREAYDLIKEDLKWLGVVWHEEYIQSLRMDIYYDMMREMLRRGCAYIDLCRERGRELLKQGLACETREKPPEWQLEQFDKMIEGYYGEGEAVVRVKTDPKHPNPSIRDWVAMRIINTTKHPHPIVGSKYVVWPTYNFAVSVDDHLMGVTHVLRGKEHQVNTEKQLYVYRCMEWEPPVFIHFGRLKLEGFIMSKSYIRRLLEENPDRFLGYDDPRFGTIAGLRRRGILPEAIREVILTVGIKPGDAKISWSNLAAVNRKILDPIADRIMFVDEPVELTVEMKGCRTAKLPFHPDRPNKVREISVCPGDPVYINRRDLEAPEIRLMGLGNFAVNLEDGKIEFIGESLQYAREKKLPIIQYVPAKSAIPVEVLVPEGLELRRVRGYAEQAISMYKPDDRLQFMRFGFVRIENTSNEGVIAIYTHD